jgi:dUTP pyrophosphatase
MRKVFNMAGSGSGHVSVNKPTVVKATVEIKAFREDALIPKKATESAAGYDLCAWLKDSYDEQTLIAPHSTLIVPTGLNVNIPNGYEIQCRIDSEIVNKYAVCCMNISVNEEGELYVNLINHNKIPFSLKHNQKIGSFYFVKIY